MSLETYLDRNFKREIPFIAFAIFSLMCFEKDNVSSIYKPRCLENGFQATGTLLNENKIIFPSSKIGGMLVSFLLLTRRLKTVQKYFEPVS